MKGKGRAHRPRPAVTKPAASLRGGSEDTHLRAATASARAWYGPKDLLSSPHTYRGARACPPTLNRPVSERKRFLHGRGKRAGKQRLRDGPGRHVFDVFFVDPCTPETARPTPRFSTTQNKAFSPHFGEQKSAKMPLSNLL